MHRSDVLENQVLRDRELHTRVSRRNPAAYLQVVLALLCCTLNLTLLAVPLVGLMFLPSLFGAVCWASAALKSAELID